MAVTWQRKVCVRADGREQVGGGSREDVIPGQTGSQPEGLAKPQMFFQSGELFFLSLGPRAQ